MVGQKIIAGTFNVPNLLLLVYILYATVLVLDIDRPKGVRV